MTIAAWLQRNASAHAHDPALAIGPRPLKSYAELTRSVASIAGWLKEAVKIGSAPVAIVSETRPDAFETLLACWWAGVSAATIDPRMGEGAVIEALSQSSAKIVFACPRGASAIAARARVAPERLIVFGGFDHQRAEAYDPIALQPSAQNAPAWIRYALGPDGAPRAATFTHRSLMFLALSILAELDAATPRDAQICAESWCGESGLMFLPVLARAGVTIAPESGGADPAEIFEIAGVWRRASVLAPPQLLDKMVHCSLDFDASAFRSVLVGGAPAPSAGLVAALDRFGPRLAKVYGRDAFPLGLARLNRHDVAARTEAGWRDRLDTTGRPFLLTEVEAVDAAGRPLPTGEMGELCAKGPLRMQSFWRDAKGTNASMRREWLRTGDYGSIDASGHVRLLGRMADLVRIGGRLVAPDAAEAALRAGPCVLDAALVQPRDCAKECAIAAYLVLDADAPDSDDLEWASDLAARAKAALGDGAITLELRRCLRLPLDLSGVVDRADLRRIETERCQNPPRAQTPSPAA